MNPTLKLHLRAEGLFDAGEQLFVVRQGNGEFALAEAAADEAAEKLALLLVEILLDELLDELIELRTAQSRREGFPRRLDFGNQFLAQARRILVAELRAENQIGEGARLARLVPMPDNGQVGTAASHHHAAMTTIVIAGDRFAFPKWRRTIGGPSAGERGATRQSPIPIGTTPLRPIRR